jgi:hypothetical protein
MRAAVWFSTTTVMITGTTTICLETTGNNANKDPDILVYSVRKIDKLYAKNPKAETLSGVRPKPPGFPAGVHTSRP